MSADEVDYWKIPVPVIEEQMDCTHVIPKMEGNTENASVPIFIVDPIVEGAKTEEREPEIEATVQTEIPLPKETDNAHIEQVKIESEVVNLEDTKISDESESDPVEAVTVKKIEPGIVDINTLLRHDKVNSMSKRWLTVFTNNFPQMSHDVTFFVGPAAEKVSCHKLVLSVASSIFQSMFEDKASTNNEINLLDSDPDAFLSMVEYAYTGELPDKVSTPENLIALMIVTHKFSIPEVWKNCSFLLEKSLCLSNAVKIYKVADSYKIDGLKKKAECFIVENFSEISNSVFFYDFTHEDLLAFLQCDNLTIHSENDLFIALIRWAKFQCNRENKEETPENLRKILDQVIYQVYYSTMSVVDIVSTVDPTKIFSQEEFLILLKHVALPKDERERLMGAFAKSEQLPKPKRSIIKNVQIFSKDQFPSLEDRRFNREIFYSDAFEIVKNEQRLHLKSISYVIKSKPTENITFHIKIVGGIAPNQEVVTSTVSALETLDSELSQVVFKEPLKLSLNKKYTIMFSPKQGQLMALMSQEKQKPFVCEDPSKSVCLKFHREHGVVAALRFIYL